MAQKLLKGAQTGLQYAKIGNPGDEHLAAFLDACKNNDIALAERLASRRDAGTLTFGLNEALKGNHLDLASRMLSKGATWDAFTIKYASASFEAVKLLVESGYDVNTGMPAGAVLLPLVLQRNDEACIRYLLAHGADPRLGPPLIARNPLINARPEPNSYWTLNMAAAFCSTETFALLLSHGADAKGAIALHYAASHGYALPDLSGVPGISRVPMLEYLVNDLGFDVNGMDDMIEITSGGRACDGTPLSYAVRGGCVEEAQWLLAHGADPDIKSNFGISARMHAQRLPRDHELVALLGGGGE
ncbi:ankyrin repeat-containing domain protein [Paraphoma chrysanthemicola]|nr:ankyrin repeat-containing domain protein [Paraphoma chrysanthemicola]